MATPFITDDELRARYGDAAELLIDALDRKVETQKFANFSRDREAVEHAESMSHPDPDDERDRRRDDAMMGD